MPVRAIKVEPEINSWEDVDRQLQSLSELSCSLNTCRSRYQAQIESLKERMKQEVTVLTREMERLAREVYLYVLVRRDQLDGRSKSLLHGAVAFRRSIRLKLPRDQKKVIETLKRLGKFECIETAETVKKLALRKEEPAVIEAVGATLVEKDNFRIELPDHVFEYERNLKIVHSR